MKVYLVQRMSRLVVTHTEVFATQEGALRALTSYGFTEATHGEPGRKCEYMMRGAPPPMLEGITYWLEEVRVQ